jgi:Ethanolamine utilization protein EutJ (predicted chaperonin)
MRFLTTIWKRFRSADQSGYVHGRPPGPRPVSTAAISDKIKPSVREYTPPAIRERTLLVGVDFGTSTTKVVFQDLTDNIFEVFRWRPAAKGVAAALLPSTVTIRRDDVCFGLSVDELKPNDIHLSSIKLCVLCGRQPVICRCGSDAAHHGCVRLPEVIEPIPASSLACLFLSHVFHAVERQLSSRFDGERLLLIWNTGCPVDNLDALDTKSEWERMVGLAWTWRNRVNNPCSLGLVNEVTRGLSDFAVPAEADRHYFVQPEGLAAVKAFLESPRAESKSYAIVDVGAGTTEVSFFFNATMMAEPGRPTRPSYLSDSTSPVGGVRIDAELAQAWNTTVEDARRRKEAGRETLPHLSSVGLICSQYHATCRTIVREQKLISPYDKQFDLFLIGGGSRLAVVQQALTKHQLPGNFKLVKRQKLQPPHSLGDRKEFKTDYDLLANACGLASSLDWDYYPPREVAPMVVNRSGQKRREWDNIWSE